MLEGFFLGTAFYGPSFLKFCKDSGHEVYLHVKILQFLSLCSKGISSGHMEGPQEGDCSLVKTEATVKTRRRADASAGKSR